MIVPVVENDLSISPVESPIRTLFSKVTFPFVVVETSETFSMLISGLIIIPFAKVILCKLFERVNFLSAPLIVLTFIFISEELLLERVVF